MSDETTSKPRRGQKLSALDKARQAHRTQAEEPEAPPWDKDLAADHESLAVILFRFFNGEISKTEAADALQTTFFPVKDEE